MYPQITESHLGSTSNSSSNTNSSNKENGIATAATKCLCTLVREESEDALDVSSHVPRCPACVYRALKPHLDRHAQAVADHALARQECARVLQSSKPGGGNPQPMLGELQEESRQLRERLSYLRQQCADMAVRVASQAVENDTQREHIQDLQLQPPSHSLEEATNMVPQVQLERLEQSVLEGSLRQAIQLTSKQVRVLRFQWARKAFAMHRLDIDPSDTQLTMHQQQRMHRPHADAAMPRRARGIGKIGGLPLPHAGPELYGVLPPTELQSALRLVASVTSSVARCLGIVLPHPILLTPAEQPNADITDTVSDQALLHRIRENHHAVSLYDEPAANNNTSHNNHGNFHGGSNPAGGGVLPSITSSAYWTSQPMRFGTSSTSSILSLMDTSYWKRSAQKALARATGHPPSSTGMGSTGTHASGHPQYPSHAQQQYATNVAKTLSTTPTPFIPPSMDAQQLAMRIQYATAAVLAEDDRPGSSQFALTTTTSQSSQDFAIALQLLQNDVVALCIRAGVNVDTLWPAEAVLLNLFQLDQYCREQTAVPY